MNENKIAFLRLIRDILVEGQKTDQDLVQIIGLIIREAYKLGYQHGKERKPEE